MSSAVFTTGLGTYIGWQLSNNNFANMFRRIVDDYEVMPEKTFKENHEDSIYEKLDDVCLKYAQTFCDSIFSQQPQNNQSAGATSTKRAMALQNIKMSPWYRDNIVLQSDYTRLLHDQISSEKSMVTNIKDALKHILSNPNVKAIFNDETILKIQAQLAPQNADTVAAANYNVYAAWFIVQLTNCADHVTSKIQIGKLHELSTLAILVCAGDSIPDNITIKLARA